MGKSVVAYFSASGKTKAIAKKMAEAGAADLYEIRPAVPYTKEDLDWTDKESRSTREMQTLSSRPELAGDQEFVTDASVVFLGFPIWWYTAPTVICTFLETYDFSGKTIVPFATSGGSGMKKAVDMIRELVPKATVEEGKLLNGSWSEKELQSWMEQF